MLRVPTVGATIVVGEGRLQTFQSHVGAAHDSLPHVVEAVDHVPVVVIGYLVAGGQAWVSLNDSELFLLLAIWDRL